MVVLINRANKTLNASPVYLFDARVIRMCGHGTIGFAATRLTDKNWHLAPINRNTVGMLKSTTER